MKFLSSLNGFAGLLTRCAIITALIYVASRISNNFFFVLGVERACGTIAGIILGLIVVEALIESIVQVVLFVRNRRKQKKDGDYDVFTWPE